VLFVDLKGIDAAVASYQKLLPVSDGARLSLFRGLWEIQDRHASLVAKVSEPGFGYEVPDPVTVENWYWGEKPVLLMAPATLDVERFAAALEEYAQYLSASAGLSEENACKLSNIKWTLLVSQSDWHTAGYDPAAYIDECCVAVEQQGLSAALARVVFSLALRTLLEPVARAIMEPLLLAEGNTVHDKPLRCPICGSRASAAFVGETSSSQGMGRLLHCALCGTDWEFERIRCACCGTQNQAKLHYFHIEGDEAHRLHNCEECGGYMRTVFQENLRAPFSFEVEDVVMARLDMVAHDKRFNPSQE
jgi:FdhE protein